MSPPARTNMVRLVFLGAAGVDKTPLIHRFLHDRFERKYTCTVGELHVLEYVSLAEVRRLRDEILKQRGGRGAPIVVVGSKADLSELEGRQLSAADVMARVEGHSYACSVEASVRTGGNRCVRTAATGEVDRAAEPGGVEAQRKYAQAICHEKTTTKEEYQLYPVIRTIAMFETGLGSWTARNQVSCMDCTMFKVMHGAYLYQ